MSKRTQSPTKSGQQTGPQEYRKPQADAFTVLLLIALLMLLLGTAVLWMTMKDDYNYMIKGGPSPVWHRPAAGSTFDASHGIA